MRGDVVTGVQACAIPICSFTLAADGSWSYTADDSQAAIQQLGAGQSSSEEHTSELQSPAPIECRLLLIKDTNDVPVIGGVATGSVTEDAAVAAGNLVTSAALTFFFFNDTATTEIYPLPLHDALPICSFTLAADGSWSYTADDSQAAIQQLGAGQS